MVNTPSSRRSSDDNAVIYQAAIRYKVPYITTTAAAIAAARGISARRQGAPRIRPMETYYQLRKSSRLGGTVLDATSTAAS